MFLRSLLITLAVFAVVPNAMAQPARPNVVLILMDDLGYADVGCMGAKDVKTPNIDRIAAEGVRFTQFYSNAPVCTPTRAGLMTGRWQQRVGLEWAFGFTAEQQRRVNGQWVAENDKLAPGLDPAHSVLARFLKLAGYRTGCFGKWHLGYRPQFNPVRHGFDEYFGVLLGHADYWRYNYFDNTNCLFENEQPAKAKGYLTDLLNDRAVSFIDRHAKASAKEPFFLYVPHLAVHFPFHPPDEPERFVTKANYNEGSRADYAKMIERVDDGVGRILQTLAKHKLTDNTLVIFTSDNGGYRLSDNSPLFHHKSTVWEGGVRVPCLMRWPAVLPAGRDVQQAGITMDLTATILTAAGAVGKNGAEPKLDGIDLLPILTGKQKETERTFCWRIDRADRRQKAVRHGKWKYVKDGMIELLFDLDADIGERRNIAFRHPNVLANMQRLLAEWEADVDREPAAWRVR
jgi:arylsulfatase A-like enzyme